VASSLLVALIPLALAVEPAADSYKLPVLCGYAVFKICGASRTNKVIPEWVAISPNAITTITNPPDSPDGCVKVFSITGRGVYVYGDEVMAAQRLRQADQERREELCD
jgi:hypothetical protein